MTAVEPSAAPSGAARSRLVWRLGLLFGTLYFVQGFAEPTEGLIAQPVNNLLARRGHSVTAITTFAALLTIPWTLKPLYGLLIDFVPLAGSRRRSYLLAATLLTTASLALLFGILDSHLTPGQLLWLLLIPTVGVAFSDVVIDALMVEQGQRLNLTGRLQSIQWAAMYAATLLAGPLGGYLAVHKREPVGFLICAGLTLVTVVLAWRLREAPTERAGGSFREHTADLKAAVRQPALWGALAFMFLWNFNPFSNTVLQLHMTQSLELSPQVYGNCTSLFALGSIAACGLYAWYCRRWSQAALVHLAIVTGVASTLGYWWLRDSRSALWISLYVGVAYMTGNLILFDLAARVCPPRVAGTAFALFMAVSNLATALATHVGGQIYDRLAEGGNTQFAFNALVAAGAACTAACWLIPAVRGKELVASGPSTGSGTE